MTTSTEEPEYLPSVQRFPADHPGIQLALLNQWAAMRSTRPDGDTGVWTERIAADAIACAVSLVEILGEWRFEGHIAMGHPWGESVRGLHSDVVRFQNGTALVPWSGTELWVERGFSIRRKPKNNAQHLPRLQLVLFVWGEGCKETERSARARFREMELQAIARQRHLPEPPRPKKVFPLILWVPDPGDTPDGDDGD